MKDFEFKALRKNNLELLYNWFKEPTINQWYAQNKKWTLNDIKKKYLPRINEQDSVPSFLIYADNDPIGFIQYYSLSKNLPENISNQSPLFKKFAPSEMAGIDFFIAENQNRRKGLGAKIINHFLDVVINNKFKVVIVDPDKNNIQAIRCFKKSGFKLSSYSEDTKHLVLLKKIKAIKK